jgi:LuxR family maltose regulon positive regulatory protein
MQVLRGAYADASQYLEQLRATLAEPPKDAEFGDDEASLRADWFVMQALVSYMQGDMATSKKMAEQGLTLAPEQDSRTRSLAHYALASVYQARAEYGVATEAYQLAIRYGRAGNALVAEIMGIIGLAGLALEQGRLHLALEITEPAIDRIEQSGAMPPFGGLLYSALAEVYFQWGELARTRQLVEQSLQLCRLGGYNTSEIFCHVSLSRIAQLEGDLEAAAREVRTAEDLMPLQLPDYIRQDVVAQKVRLYLARSRPDGAQMTLQGQGFSFQGQFRFPPLPAPQSLTASLGFLYNSALRVFLYTGLNDGAPDDLNSGITLAGRLIESALLGQKLPVAIEALLLRAQLRAAAADSQEDEAGVADTARALALGKQEGFVSLFLEQGEPVAESLARLLRQNRLDSVAAGYAGRILDSFAALQGPENETRDLADGEPRLETGDLIEPLTERELDVLRLMAEGLKYKEIAARLFISLNTVRYHVKALYSKLGVNNRTQAIDAARRQHLI